MQISEEALATNFGLILIAVSFLFCLFLDKIFPKIINLFKRLSKK